MTTASIHEEGAFSGLEELAENEVSIENSIDFIEEEEEFTRESAAIDCAGLSIDSDCLHPRPA